MPSGQSAAFSLLGHKGDLILVHFRHSFDELEHTEKRLAQLRLWDYLEPASSYLSVVELGLYESSLEDVSLAGGARHRSRFPRNGTPRSSRCWRGSARPCAPRLYPEMPPHKYLCFYPMDRKRGEDEELVHAAHGRAPAPDARARHDRPPLRGRQ